MQKDLAAESVIAVKDLKKNYKNFEAVRGITFDVKKGEIFGILGPNGAGKTTTLEIMEGLKQQTSGNCTVLGFDNQKSAREIKKRIGVQLQSSEFFDFLTISELLVMFAALYDIDIDPIETLKRVNLESKAQNTVKQLSGGQKQRFMIASALSHNPSIIFLDEPTTGLDPQARRDIWGLIKELNEQGTTVVLTTHYMEEAEYLCNRIAIMDSGKILKIDAPRRLIADISNYYQLSFFTNDQINKGVFEGIATAQNVFLELPKVVIELTEAGGFNEVVKRLHERNISHSFLTLKSATLEDVYLKLTGKELTE